MKAKDAPRLDAIRFLSAAIKQREIELRESGKEVRCVQIANCKGQTTNFRKASCVVKAWQLQLKSHARRCAVR
jgi:uncharacterized protein YqeY